MRINIERRPQGVMKAAGLENKKEVVKVGLRARQRQTKIRRFRGKLPWVGDLDALRSDR